MLCYMTELLAEPSTLASVTQLPGHSLIAYIPLDDRHIDFFQYIGPLDNILFLHSLPGSRLIACRFAVEHDTLAHFGFSTRS